MRRKERRRNEVSRKAWQAATNALLWYEDNKREYAELTDEILSGSGSRDSTAGTHPDPTGGAAVQMYTSARLQRITAEVEAVERAVCRLQPEELRVIRARYWTGQRGMMRKPRQYDLLQDLGYSTRSMIRISKATVLRVATLLGEK